MNCSRLLTLVLLVLTLGCGGSNGGVNSPSAQNALPTDNGILVLEVAALRASARTGGAQLILAGVDQEIGEHQSQECVQSLDTVDRLGFSVFTRVLVSSNPVAVACAREWPMFECESQGDGEPTCDVQTFPWGFAVVERPDADVPNRPSDAEILTLAQRLALGQAPEDLWVYGYVAGDYARAMRPRTESSDDPVTQQLDAWIDQGVNLELRYGPLGFVLSSEVNPAGQPVAQELLRLAEAGVQEMVLRAEESGQTAMTGMLRSIVQQTTFEARGNRVEIRSPLGLEQLTIVAAVGLPAITSYADRSRAAEARANLRALQAGVEAWSQSAAESAQQVRGRLQLPPIPSAPMSIRNPGEDAQMGDYLAPAWNQYAFLPDGPTYYGYEVAVTGEVIYLRAVGNLDGDEVQSVFVIRGQRDPSTGRVIWDEMQIENELE